MDSSELDVRMRILEIKFERDWDFEGLFESSGFLRKIKLRRSGLWELNFERDWNLKLFETWKL